MAKKAIIKRTEDPLTLTSKHNGKAVSAHTQAQAVASAEKKALILADNSGSMDGVTKFDGKRRIEIAREALAEASQHIQLMKVYAFNSSPQEMAGPTLPEPTGCTAMGLAMAEVLKWAKAFGLMILVSDGLPTDGERWREEAEKYAQAGVPIYPIYAGDGDDWVLREIARITGGVFRRQHFDAGPLALAETILQALPSGK